jgi:hypothetical protein
MSKKVINQNTNYKSELLNSIGSDFIFDENPINRVKKTTKNSEIKNNIKEIDKTKALTKLKEEINSIQDCSLKLDSKKIVFVDGNIYSHIMLI